MEPTPAPTSRKTPLLPRGDRQLAALAVLVAKYWGTQPWLTLRYTTSDLFLPVATGYETAVSSREQAGAARPVLADEILELDQLIDVTLYRVKNRLVDKYDKKKAPKHYLTVGIIKDGKEYIIDAERTARAAALLTLVAGLKSEKIDGGEWGTDFWEPIATRYNELVPLLADTTGDIAKAVAHKDTQRALVTQVLYSIAKVLDANYPDEAEYKAQLRAAGFQRESY
ncbi:hypothetical protein Q5H93_09900 [Hymenobacter sp. ASUV-10]|uniref:Uncharacterized protein n=1 Tax=Hymenobacter aranciens TaxID=3063996 RepID=A0ABT9BA34_9BACT|nr:hypothetical protein [Hymenobacter sp. ASUV-10]MDO7875042.1 hypothetical protein [Hymenobacter sp. ASUV-10]